MHTLLAPIIRNLLSAKFGWGPERNPSPQRIAHLSWKPLKAATVAWTALLLGCSGQPLERPTVEEAFAARNSVKIRQELERNSPVVAQLQLGERVEIVGRRRRFVRVRTAAGVEGWTRETRLATSELQEFKEQLVEQTESDPPQGTFRALRALNVHLEPYRWSPTIYQLQEDEAAELLRHRLVDRLPHKPEEDRPPPAPTGLDDWYLIRVASGQAGWALSTGLYSAIPDEVKQYAERRRITSYFSLGEVDDTARKVKKPTWLWTQIERSKQPFDFDQIRVFMWSRRRGAYQTIKLERGLEGYLPVTLEPVVESTRGKGPGFTIVTERKGERVARTYVVLNYRVYRTGEAPAPPAPAEIRFEKKTTPPAPPPSLVDRFWRWWKRSA